MIKLVVLLALAVSLAAPIRAEEAPIRLLALGDSLIHGYGLSDGETFPERLEAALRAENWPVTVINGGNSGDTTTTGLARLDWALADRPQAVIVEFGANDMLRGLDPGQAEINLDAMLTRLKRDGLAVLLVGMRAAPNWGADYVARFDAIFSRLAERHKVMLYPFFLEGVAMNPDLNQPDGLHPNAAGVAEIVQRILPSVIALLDAAGATKGSVDE